MSSNLEKTLKRLAVLRQKNPRNSNGGGKRNERMQFWKAKSGKNELLFLTYPDYGDPFGIWGQHKNLMTGADKYKTVPCPAFNKNESCTVCDLIERLKSDDWKGNQALWKPIELDCRTYSPVIDLQEPEKGVQYWNYGQSVYSQVENWLQNVEEDELPFYSREELYKVIVSYDKEAAPKDMYKLDKKPLRGIKKESIDAWAEQVRELSDLLGYFYKKDEEVTELLEQYLDRMSSQIEADDKDIEEKVESLKDKD